MKKFIFIFIFIQLIFSSCEKLFSIIDLIDEPTSTQTTSVCFEFGLGTTSGSMTKASGSEIFDEFYTEMEKGNLIADSYNLTLTEINTGVKYSVSGKWNKHEMITLNVGKYHVTGTSTANGNEYIQDKCSFVFEQNINVESTSSTIELTGKYDSFLLIFDGENFNSLTNYSGVDTTPFYTFNTYKYAFVNSGLYNVDYKYDAYIEGSYNNNTFKYYTGNIAFGKGRYYIYNYVNNEFNFPKMDEGDGTEVLPNDGKTNIGENYLEVYGDSLYVSMTNAGMLYPLYMKLACGVETSDEYGEHVWNGVKKVRIDGNIDARDFSTLKWNFRSLTNLDITNTKIVDYAGVYGTVEGYYYEYNKNEIPIGAFFYWMSNNIRNFPEELYDEGMASLEVVKLPDGITKIDRNAFARAYNLKEINISDDVNVIGMCAFRHCHSIEKVYLPKSVTEIGWYTFTDMNSLKEFHVTSQFVPYVYECFGFFYDGTNDEYFEGEGIERGDMSTVKYLKYDKVTLYVPNGFAELYTDWNNYFEKIVENDG